MAPCPAMLMRRAALLLDGVVHLPSELGLVASAPSFELTPRPHGTIQFGHLRQFPLAALMEDRLRELAEAQVGGDGDELAVAAALAEDVMRQWRRSREQGLPYDTATTGLLDRCRIQLSGHDIARLVPDEMLLWFRWAYALVPREGGRVSARGRRYEPVAPMPVERWWSGLEQRVAELVRAQLERQASAFAHDPRPLERLRARLAGAAGRTVRLHSDPPLTITWDTHDSLMSFTMAFPGFAQQDASRRGYYAFPPGTLSLVATAHHLRRFVLAPAETLLRTLVEMPSAPHVRHPFVSEHGRGLCSAGNVERVFQNAELTPAAMILTALERGVQVLLTGQGSHTVANPYRKLAESGAPRISRLQAQRQGLIVIPWVNAERGRRKVEI